MSKKFNLSPFSDASVVRYLGTGQSEYLEFYKKYKELEGKDSERENLKNDFEKKIKENGYIDKNIDSLSDYIQMVQMIISNWLSAKVSFDDFNEYPILIGENIFNASNELLEKTIKNHSFFFRGQSTEYGNVAPSLFRNSNFLKNEDNIDHEFESLNDLIFSKNNKKIERIALMQHHGFPTRILDITSNALVALFFAVNGNIDSDGYVYLFAPSISEVKPASSDTVSIKSALTALSFEEKIQLVENYPAGKDKIVNDDISAVNSLYHEIRKDYPDFKKEIKNADLYNPTIFIPTRIDQRIVQQSSAFIILGLDGYEKIKSDDISKTGFLTFQEHITRTIAGESFLYSPITDLKKKEIDKYNISTTPKIRIPSISKKKILIELNNVGINEGSVLADLDSYGNIIKSKYK